MSDEIEIHWEWDDGWLSLTCGNEAFDRIAALAVGEAEISTAEISTEAIKAIYISKPTSAGPTISRKSRIFLYLAFIAVFGAIAAVFGTGLAVVIAWLFA